MDTKIFDEKYWTFYLELENEFKQIEKYIPINETNNETFSYKYMKLLFSICSEIDTILKSFIKFKDKNSKNITKFFYILNSLNILS